MKSERGFTLPEVLFATLIGFVVLGAAVTMLSATADTEPRTRDRVDKIADARLAMADMTRELRQGSTVSTATANQIGIVTYVHRSACGSTAQSTTAIQCRVTYTCTAGICTRTESHPDGTGSGAPRQVLSGLSNSSSVFTYSPSSAAPAYVNVEVVFPGEDGDDAISLKDGVALRND